MLRQGNVVEAGKHLPAQLHLGRVLEQLGCPQQRQQDLVRAGVSFRVQGL